MDSRAILPPQRDEDRANASAGVRSDAYLIFIVASVVLALSGAVLLLISHHDLVGMVSLVAGDLGAIGGFVAYIWRTG